MPSAHRHVERLARESSRPLHTGLERVGQVILLRAAQVGLEVVIGTKIHAGVEAAVGARSAVLVVRPPDEKLVLCGQTGQVREPDALALEAHVEISARTVANFVIGAVADGPGSARVDVGGQARVRVFPQRHVIPEVFEEKTQIPSVPISGHQEAVAAFLGGRRKPTKGQCERRWDFAKLQVKRPRNHLLTRNHHSAFEVKVKMGVLRVARGKLRVGHVNPFVGLALGNGRVKNRLALHGDGFAAQPAARLHVKTQLVLLERLPALRQHRSPDPRPRRIPPTVGARLIRRLRINNAIRFKADVIQCNKRRAVEFHLRIHRVHPGRIGCAPDHFESRFNRRGCRVLNGLLSLAKRGQAYPQDGTENPLPADDAGPGPGFRFELTHETAVKTNET